jgi:hypothetical protein
MLGEGRETFFSGLLGSELTPLMACCAVELMGEFKGEFMLISRTFLSMFSMHMGRCCSASPPFESFVKDNSEPTLLPTRIGGVEV